MEKDCTHRKKNPKVHYDVRARGERWGCRSKEKGTRWNQNIGPTGTAKKKGPQRGICKLANAGEKGGEFFNRRMKEEGPHGRGTTKSPTKNTQTNLRGESKKNPKCSQEKKKPRTTTQVLIEGKKQRETEKYTGSKDSREYKHGELSRGVRKWWVGGKKVRQVEYTKWERKNKSV